MTKILTAIKLLTKKVLSRFPSDLPVGMTSFNKWMDDVLELSGPIADKTSMTWLVSNEIMHVKSGTDRVPKKYFVKVLRKFAANQLAAAKVNEIKLQQEAAQRAAQQAKAEDTTQANGTKSSDVTV